MFRLAFATLALAAACTALAAARQTGAVDVVAEVRAAMAEGGLTKGEELLAAYRTTNGTTPEALEALCWLARGALADKLYERASDHAEEVHTAAAGSLRETASARDGLLNALGCGIEVAAMSLVERGGRSDAVYLLRKALDDYGRTAIGEQLRSNLSLVDLAGHAAPQLDAGVAAGARLPHAADGNRQPQLLFFWAHWCQDCKAESPMLAKLVEKYSPRGLTLVAPTRRYGYVANGRPAPPERELRHIVEVRDTHYRFLKHAAVPVTDANYRQYGIAAVPMHVLIDRSGVVRLYRPGRMTEAELEAAIVDVLAKP